MKTIEIIRGLSDPKQVIRTTTGYPQFVTRRVLATSVGGHRGPLNLTPCVIRNAFVLGTELSVSC